MIELTFGRCKSSKKGQMQSSMIFIPEKGILGRASRTIRPKMLKWCFLGMTSDTKCSTILSEFAEINTHPPQRPSKTVIFQRGEYTKPMGFDGWFFKGGSTWNRWAFEGDFSKGGVHETEWLLVGKFPKGGVHETDGFERNRMNKTFQR